jgi:hypothetical protein
VPDFQFFTVPASAPEQPTANVGVQSAPPADTAGGVSSPLTIYVSGKSQGGQFEPAVLFPLAKAELRRPLNTALMPISSIYNYK